MVQGRGANTAIPGAVPVVFSEGISHHENVLFWVRFLSACPFNGFRCGFSAQVCMS